MVNRICGTAVEISGKTFDVVSLPLYTTSVVYTNLEESQDGCEGLPFTAVF